MASPPALSKGEGDAYSSSLNRDFLILIFNNYMLIALFPFGG